MQINFYPLMRGIGSYVLPRSLFYRPGSGGTYSSEYCYSVWHRHLFYLLSNGLFKEANDIKRIAEIGPGDSLGIGLSAMYTGASEYYAFDVIKHTDLSKNLQINSELKQRFIRKDEIPNTHRQRFTAPSLPSYDYPSNYLNLTEEFIEKRKDEIDKALIGANSKELKIEYIVPWLSQTSHDLPPLDLIFSQAVMEHVEDISFAYQQMFKWLKPGGVISHQIDFKTHEMTKDWNGHWFIGSKMWELLAHGRKYPMNRLPLSSHIQMIEKAGFEIVFIKSVTKENRFMDTKPQVPGVVFTNEDLISSGALIQAIKR